MNEEPNYPSIDTELEARIVACVLGEASDFEREELNRIMEARPELAAFKEEIQSVHGLLRDVGADESIAENDDWKLSPGKRDAVLAVMSGEAQQRPQVVSKFTDRSKQGRSKQRGSKQRSFLWNIAKIAAVLCVAGFFGMMLIPSRFAAREVASSFRNSNGSSGAFMNEAPAPAVELFMADSAATMTVDEEHLQAAKAIAIAESDYSNRSRSSLSDIRESLGADVALPSPYFLQDDVQYFPAKPEFNLTREKTAVDNKLSERGGDLFGDVEAKRSEADGRLRAEVRAQLQAASPESPRPSTDDLALLPHRVQSGGADESIDALNRKDSFFNSELSDSESDNGAALGMSAEQQSAPEFAMPFGAEERGRAQKSAQGEQPLHGGTNLQFLLDFPVDSPAAGKEIHTDGGGRNRDYEESEERVRSRAGEIAASGSRGNAWSVELTPEAVVELGGTARPKSMVSGSGGQKTDADNASDQADFDSGLPALDRFTYEGRRSSSRSSREVDHNDFKNKESAEGFKEEFSKDRLGRLGDKETAAVEIRDLDEGESNGRQIPAPVAGTAFGRSPRELWFDQAGVDTQPNIPDGEPAGLEKSNESLPEKYREGVESYSERIESEQKDIGGELLPQRGQLAVGEDYGRYRNDASNAALEKKPESLKKKAPNFAKIAGDTIVRDVVASRGLTDEAKKSAPSGLNEKTAEEEAFSTFSLHVSDVSFKLARAALAAGTWPDAAKIRIEEFVNALDYGDPMPGQGEKVACRVEQAVHPFLQQRNLLRVAMRTAAAGRASNTPLRLTLLLDNSGSMERIDRQQTVRRAFALLAQQLEPIDQVTLISFARQPRLLADKVSGAQSSQLVELIENLPSEGGTNIEAALQLAFEKAREQQVDNAQNRIILLTDGAVNLGDANPESLSRMITTMRGAGIAFDAAGISAEGLNDEILEALTRQGDGRYYLLDSLEAADDGFARQIAGALRPSAGNVKVQVEFNPKRVGRYKLLGFEKHRLDKEDFRNDKVDAAEMAAAESGVAVYQFEAKPDGEGDVGSVSVRFRDLSTGQMIENYWPIPYQPDAPRLDQAAPSLRIATTAALLAAKLQGDGLGETVDLRMLSNLIAALPDQDRDTNRVAQLRQMIEQARQVSGE